MDGLECTPYLHSTLQALAQHPRIELYLLANRTERPGRLDRARRKLRSAGLARLLSIAAFKALVAIEGVAVRAFAPALRGHFRRVRVDENAFVGSVTITPLFSRSGLLVEYGEDDLRRIRALDLDLILRGNASGIFRGGILRAAKHGIISFHHGDNRWNRGGPPAFWEVWYRKAATGFVVQILNEQLDAGEVIFRGEVPTKRCYTANLINLFRASNPFMAEIITAYADSGTLPAPLPAEPFAHRLLRTPPLSVTAGYAVRTARTFASLALRRKVLRVRERWSVAFTSRPWQDADLGKAKVVTNPRGRFLADPFVVARGGDTVIFVEDFHYDSRRGSISAVRVLSDGGYELVPDVVREPFHLSFPYVFEHDGELFMIPESHQAKSIREPRSYVGRGQPQRRHPQRQGRHAVPRTAKTRLRSIRGGKLDRADRPRGRERLRGAALLHGRARLPARHRGHASHALQRTHHGVRSRPRRAGEITSLRPRPARRREAGIVP